MTTEVSLSVTVSISDNSAGDSFAYGGVDVEVDSSVDCVVAAVVVVSVWDGVEVEVDDSAGSVTGSVCCGVEVAAVPSTDSV